MTISVTTVTISIQTCLSISPQDIILSGSFKEKVEEVKEIHEKFECPYGYTDSYGKRRLKQYNIVEEAMNAMAKYADERNINIIDLFARFDADGSMSVSHEEFKIGLKVPRKIRGFGCGVGGMEGLALHCDLYLHQFS